MINIPRKGKCFGHTMTEQKKFKKGDLEHVGRTDKSHH
jgi:hypothetical protein